jgi:hypothetical protein
MEEMRGATESPLNHRSITRRAPTKGKCYSQESKKGTNSGTYRGKQLRAKCAEGGAGVPLMAHNTSRVPTLSEVKRTGESDLDLGIKSGLRGDRGASQGFLYTESESESET